jgi:hypothetical protein
MASQEASASLEVSVYTNALMDDLPRPRCRWSKAFASMLCPVLSIQPHPASLVNPPSARDQLQGEVDIRDWGKGFVEAGGDD